MFLTFILIWTELLSHIFNKISLLNSCFSQADIGGQLGIFCTSRGLHENTPSQTLTRPADQTAQCSVLALFTFPSITDFDFWTASLPWLSLSSFCSLKKVDSNHLLDFHEQILCWIQRKQVVWILCQISNGILKGLRCWIRCWLAN